MRDTRQQRKALVVLLSAGIGAVIGEFFVTPALSRRLKVRR